MNLISNSDEQLLIYKIFNKHEKMFHTGTEYKIELLEKAQSYLYMLKIRQRKTLIFLTHT